MTSAICRAITQAKNLRNFINRHELTRRKRAASYWRLLRWQAVSRLVRGPFDVPFVNETRLIVSRGMVGATGNVYAGLHEFHEMAFVLHFLRAGDLFADIGANVGTYTVLASGVCGATTIAFEPIASTRIAMQNNIARNGIGARIELRPKALGMEPGNVLMTNLDDTMNRVVAIVPQNCSAETVVMSTMDIEFADKSPILIKIDAEGSDADIVFGGTTSIGHSDLKAIIAEFSGLSPNESTAHAYLLDQGFRAYSYEPFARKLVELQSYAYRTIYARDLAFVEHRLATAPAFKVLGFDI